ncbi:MAG: gephyrin-like molybdotransferase Glp [Myxococcota bacterium]
MISIEAARRLVTEGLSPLSGEDVPLLDALGRICAINIMASRSLPGFDNSAMDGYAVRAADLQSERSLRVVAQIPAGVVSDRVIGPGEAARIFTGAPMPGGADSVVIQEDVRVEGDQIWITDVPAAGRHIRRRGGDILDDEILIEAGWRLTAGRLAVLASQGHRTVAVVRRPRVAILPNGDELVPIDAAVGPGQVPNTNAHMLSAQVLQAGGEPWAFDPIADDPDVLTQALNAATAGADLVLTTGGMSVGDFDYARDALRAEGQLAFYKVRMKPGKPLGRGLINGVPVLGLPGNPVSTFVGFALFGRPMLRTLAGYPDVDHPVRSLPLGRAVKQNRTRPEFQRCALSEGRLIPWPKQGSSMISSLIRADLLARIPQGDGVLAEGTVVEAIDLRVIE